MPDPIRERITAELTAADGMFPIVEEEVRGRLLPVLAQRRRSLLDFMGAAAGHGDSEFLVHDDRRITHADFADLVAAEAHVLATEHRVGPGDRVAILAANSPDWVIAYFATLSLGAIAAAYNGWWTPDEIGAATELTTPALILGDEKRLARVPAGLGTRVVDFEADRDRLLGEAGRHALPSVEIAEDDPATIFFTSGTTGRAKGATASHRGLVGFVEVQFLNGAIRAFTAAEEAERRGEEPAAMARPRNRVLATSPLFHVSGLSASILLNMAAGGTLVFRSGRFDPGALLEVVERERITTWTLLGSMGPRVLDHTDLATADLSSVTNVGFGGAPVSPDIQQRVRNAFPNAAANVGIGYGSSETVSVVASHGGRDLEERPEATGWIMPTVEVQIRDDDGTPLPDGVNGHIWVLSAYTMLGYWDDPDATAEAVDDDGWLNTGDIGRMEDGVLTIDSRARDLILRNADNIYPTEVEYRLEDHPAVAEVAVYGIDHPEMGQEVAASVVPTADTTLTEDELGAFVAASLAAYKVPTTWDIRTEPLPRNAAGKVVKSVLTGERDLDQHED